MSTSNISRKDFIKNSALGLVGFSLLPGILNAVPNFLFEGIDIKNTKKFILKNVRLETGFISDETGVIGTKTELFSIEIKDGKIEKITKNDPQLANAIDAKGLLMLPSFKDMHIHLDKTLYGLPWQALSPKRKSVADMIAYEQEIIPELLKTSIKRAEQLISLLQNYGTTFARTHFNVDTTSGLRSLENLEIALENKKRIFWSRISSFSSAWFILYRFCTINGRSCKIG